MSAYERAYGHDSVTALPYIKEFMADQIYADCGSYAMSVVTECFASLKTAVEVKDKIRRCCRNKRAGLEFIAADGSKRKVRTTNEWAACSLLDALLARNAWSGPLLTDIVEMRGKMRGVKHLPAVA